MHRERYEGFGFLLADVSRLMRRAFQAHLQGTELSLAQARALVHISRREGLRQIELAEFLETQPITLARIIDQLSAKGLVERRVDPNDRRAYQLYLTARADEALDTIGEATNAIRAHALRDLNPEEAASAADVLQRIRDNLAALRN